MVAPRALPHYHGGATKGETGMLKRLLTIGAAALTALVSGCGDGPATVAGGWRSPATWSSMIYATKDGPLLVEIHGAPFGLPPARFRTAVAEAMTNAIFGRPSTFTTDPQQAPQPRYRVVLAFNAPDNTDPRDLCRGQVATLAQTGDRITVHGAFCEDATLLASIRGWVAKVQGAEDERFRRLISQLTRELFGTAS